MKSSSIIRTIARWLTAGVFMASGVLHFVATDTYEKIVPPVLPNPPALVYISGIFEILGGLGLLVPRTRRAAGYGLAALLVAVYPANIYHAFSGLKTGSLIDHPLYHWIRLPLQFFMIWEALWCSRSKPKI